MSRKTIYVALSQFCRDDDRPRRILMEAGFELEENHSGLPMKREEMFQALRRADAVIAGLERYNAELLSSLPRLRCLSRCGVGTDSIDLEAAKRLNIAVLITPDEVVEPVAQMTLGMILALARNFPLHFADSRSGLWRTHTGYLLSEWTIGLIGFGRIGRQVERYLKAFRPRVIVTDPYLNADQVSEAVTMLPLREMLAEADLVSIHAARRRDEGPILGCREIALMKPGSRLLNTARGYLVDEASLYKALQSGHIVAAALDVFQEEPYTGPLAMLPQVLCTPHVASLTKASRAAMELRSANNIVAFFARQEI